MAAELLAHAAFLDGKHPQSFPFFGVERRGAPVTAFARVGDAPIGERTSITRPDVVVSLERGLLGTVPVANALKEGGWLIVNGPPSLTSLPASPGVRVAAVDASRIAALNGLGSATLPIVNTAMLGALARLTGIVSLEALEGAIARHVPAHPEENRAACRAAYDNVRLLGRDAPPARTRWPPSREPPWPDGPLATLPSDLLRTASWRTLRPVIRLDRCTRCNFCWKFCPDSALGFDPAGYPVLRAEHCKGCGICAAVCPPKAIAMVAED